MKWESNQKIRHRLEKETGTIIKDWGGKLPGALIYPNTYYIGMSNLGIQAIDRFISKDLYDGAVCLYLSRSRKMDAVLTFLGYCWKTLGRPRLVQFDNAREIVGWGPAARSLSRVLRLCLRFGSSRC